MTLNNQNNILEYQKRVSENVLYHISMFVPVIEYLKDFAIDNSDLFKRELKRNHNEIMRYLLPILNKSLSDNDEDEVYHYLDCQQEMIDSITSVKDPFQLWEDLKKTIERTGVRTYDKEPDNLYNNTTNEVIGRYLDCLIYITVQYNELEKIKEENSSLHIPYIDNRFSVFLKKQLQYLEKHYTYKGNPYVYRILEHYIMTKSYLRDKSTIFDNEIQMIIKKNS